ncbi:SDR family NAD(P)-dependent oxidoreductase [Phreatobacter stygius]|uniref:SDR family oxidoreductase n=1 Tax=Phreatobacter stygius TaxID=1940610 RepID=A0A4D7B9Y0_9HYPH|nr:SDR family oxidoreductase [Phreatobacter stygius]QCI66968.1 SDR family oxidoreductase [Phreatobacter stygius]
MTSPYIALVTGAGSGIGRATTLRFVRAGARVLAVDLNPDGLAETAAFAEDPGAIETFTADVTAEDAPASAIGRAVARFGRLDWLVNNAGIGAAKAAHLTSDAEWDRYVDVNLRQLFRFSREALPHLQAGRGAIVNIASVFGLFGHPGVAPYAATKAAVVGLTRQMAADYGPKGIRVNAVAPGVIETALTRGRIVGDPRFQALNIDPIPFPRLGRPEDVANAVYFLVSEEASYVSGHVLAVDGGWSVTNYSRRGAAL